MAVSHERICRSVVGNSGCEAARCKAREIIEQSPRDGLISVIQKWRQPPGGQIEFAIRHTASLDGRSTIVLSKSRIETTNDVDDQLHVRHFPRLIFGDLQRGRNLSRTSSTLPRAP
jgi:hypothetical protein